MKVLKGLATSPGISIGQAWLFIPQQITVDKRTVNSAQIKHEVAAFRAAQVEVEAHQRKIYERTLQRLGAKDAEIFAAHIEMLRDEEFEKDIFNLIEKRHYTAVRAVKEYLDEAASVMRNLPDPFLRERAGEFQDLQTNLLLALNHLPFSSLAKAPKGSIVFALNLTPSETSQVDSKNFKGIALEGGGLTGHVAILARNSNIPAVMGVSDMLSQVNNGDMVIIDGYSGEVIINPDEETMASFKLKQKEKAKLEHKYAELLDKPAETIDGVKIKLFSNISSPEDLPSVEEIHAEGIGLFRTEFVFMRTSIAPGEEEQYELYKKVAKGMKSKPVILRLADIGGDKNLPYLDYEQEANPFLGCRGVRIYPRNHEIFVTQLRAAIRASADGDMRLMIPMVNNVEEVAFVKQEIIRQGQRLKRSNKACNPNVKVGVMIETPAAALMANQLAKVADFFSIGTNDLTQYVLAVDRSNPLIADLYDSLHPAVLRCIKSAIDAAKAHKIEVGICGEMAGQLYAAVILIGLGADELSISGKRLSAVKYFIRGVKAQDCKKWAEDALNLDSAKAVREYLAQQNIPNINQ